MEVHHHSHHAGSGRHRSKKNWTHYFWEFLMLFLAVFCGFLAEYQLEHKIEKDRERQYMASMMEDLKTDLVMLENNIKVRKSRIEMIDSLVRLLNTPNRDQHGNVIYFLARSISPPTNIFPNDRTIQQLKSSGNLRLIHKQDISNSIMAYDQNLRRALFSMGDEVEIRSEYRQAVSKIFNTSVFNDMIVMDSIRHPANNPALLSNDPGLINQFIGTAQYAKRAHQTQLLTSDNLSGQARKLLAAIKEGYHLD